MRSAVLFALIIALPAVDLEPRLKPLVTATTERAALLVSANRYATPSWDLAHASRNLGTAQQALAAGADIPLRFQQVVQGEQVIAARIEKALSEAAKPLRGSRALLVVYWTGHGFVDGSGEVGFLTNLSDSVDGGFTNTVSRQQIAQWSERVRTDARARGTEIQVVLVADACRTKTMAPPPAALLRPSNDWALFGTGKGQFAEAPDAGQAAPFTAAFAEALTKSSGLGSEVPLSQVFATTKAATEERTRGVQVPELLSPATANVEPTLARPPRVRLWVRPVDAIARTVITKATVMVDAKDALPMSDEAPLVLVPGQRQLRLTAEGYITTDVTVSARLDDTGSVLEIPLYPQVKVITGRCFSARVPVAVLGLPDGLREGLHTSSVNSDATGRFTLVVPPAAKGLRVRLFDREIVVPDDAESWAMRPLGDTTLSVPTCSLGDVRPLATAPTAPGPAIAVTPKPPVPLVPAPVTTAPKITEASPEVPLAPRTTAGSTTEVVGVLPLGSATTAATANGPGDRWPHVVATPFAATREADGTIDLRAAGSENGQLPARFLVGKREQKVVDLSTAGVGPGENLTTMPVVPIKRHNQVVDLTTLGTEPGSEPAIVNLPLKRANAVVDLSAFGAPEGSEPAMVQIPVQRANTVVDLSTLGAPDGSEPPAPTVVGERRGDTQDLTSVGTPEISFTEIPEKLKADLLKAVEPGVPPMTFPNTNKQR
jgi:hypothetical protein